MLFEDRKKVSAEYLMKKYATLEDLKKVLKKPSFEIAPHRKKIDRVNGGRIKTPAGNAFRSNFYATDPETKTRVEIRYALSHNPRIVGTTVIDNFEPRYVNFDGSVKEYAGDQDLAVYMFLNPNNAGSPLRDKNNKAKAKIDYIDARKRNDDKAKDIAIATQAMAYASALGHKDALILAKGLGIKGINKKDEDLVKVDVQEYAMKNPKQFMLKVNDQTTMIEGRVMHLVDKNIIKLTQIGNVRRWLWTSGAFKDEILVDVINPSQDPREALKNHIFSDINKYHNILNGLADSVDSRDKARQDLAKAEVVYMDEVKVGGDLPEHLKSVNDEFVYPGSESKTVEPESDDYTFEEAQAIMTAEANGKKPHHLSVQAYIKNNKKPKV